MMQRNLLRRRPPTTESRQSCNQRGRRGGDDHDEDDDQDLYYYGFVEISDTQVAMKCNDVQPTRGHHEDGATNEPARDEDCGDDGDEDFARYESPRYHPC